MQALPLISRFLPDTVRLSYGRMQDRESLELLHAAGYLAQLDAGASVVQVAVTTFRQEWRNFRTQDPAAYAQLLEARPFYLPEFDMDAALTCDELYVLEQVQSMEGGIVLSALPSRGAQGLAARVLRLRLGRLGLQTEGRAGLKTLADGLGVRDLLAVANLAGDCRALARALARSPQAPQAGLVFIGGGKDGGKMLGKARGKDFDAGVKEHATAATAGWWEENIQASFAAGKEKLQSVIVEVITTPINRLMMSLLCMQLWGDGLLSASPEKASNETVWKALNRLDGFRSGKKQAEAGDQRLLLVHLQDGCWALNAGYFWGDMWQADDEGDDDGWLSEFQKLYGEDAAEKPRAKLEERLAACAEEEDVTGFGTLRRGILRLFAWVRRSIGSLRDAMDRFLDHHPGGAQGLFAALRKGFETLGRILDLLRHGPAVETRVGEMALRTVVSRGMDPVTWVTGTPTAELYAQHQADVEDLLRQLTKGIQLVGRVLRWGLTKGNNPVSWVELGLRILKEMQANEMASR